LLGSQACGKWQAGLEGHNLNPKGEIQHDS
jgi:hypothetical protein